MSKTDLTLISDLALLVLVNNQAVTSRYKQHLWNTHGRKMNSLENPMFPFLGTSINLLKRTSLKYSRCPCIISWRSRRSETWSYTKHCFFFFFFPTSKRCYPGSLRSTSIPSFLRCSAIIRSISHSSYSLHYKIYGSVTFKYVVWFSHYVKLLGKCEGGITSHLPAARWGEKCQTTEHHTPSMTVRPYRFQLCWTGTYLKQNDTFKMIS